MALYELSDNQANSLIEVFEDDEGWDDVVGALMVPVIKPGDIYLPHAILALLRSSTGSFLLESNLIALGTYDVPWWRVPSSLHNCTYGAAAWWKDNIYNTDEDVLGYLNGKTFHLVRTAQETY